MVGARSSLYAWKADRKMERIELKFCCHADGELYEQGWKLLCRHGVVFSGVILKSSWKPDKSKQLKCNCFSVTDLIPKNGKLKKKTTCLLNWKKNNIFYIRKPRQCWTHAINYFTNQSVICLAGSLLWDYCLTHLLRCPNNSKLPSRQLGITNILPH